MARGRTYVASSLILALALAHVALAATATKIEDDFRVDEWGPSIMDGWTAWNTGLVGSAPFAAWIQEGEGRPRRIPQEGQELIGNLIDTGSRAGQVVFTAVDRHRGDIRFYDLETKVIRNGPGVVNTQHSESAPYVDGDYLTFARQVHEGGLDVFLYRFSTGRLIKVADGLYQPTQINGDYLTYWGCTLRVCHVWRYQISTKQTIRMPAPRDGRSNYYAAVTGEGVVYYVQGSHRKCGRNTKILGWEAGTVTTEFMIEDGIDLGTPEARTVGGEPILVFHEWACAPDDTGVYSLPLAA